MILTALMAHPRKLLRQAVVALLAAANTAAGAHVSSSRVDPYRKNELPAISVFTLHEDTDSDSGETAPIELTRVAKVEIAAWVEDKQANPAADAMDDIAEQIEAAMASDYYLSTPLAITAVDHATGALTVPGHNLATGDPCILRAGQSGVMPSGAPTAECFAVVIDDNTVQIAKSLADALNDRVVAYGDNGTLPLQLRVDSVVEQLLESTDMELAALDGKSDPLVGIIVLTYSVTYRTTPATIATPDDFLTADVKQQLVGGVSDTQVVEDTITVRNP